MNKILLDIDGVLKVSDTKKFCDALNINMYDFQKKRDEYSDKIDFGDISFSEFLFEFNVTIEQYYNALDKCTKINFKLKDYLINNGYTICIITDNHEDNIKYCDKYLKFDEWTVDLISSHICKKKKPDKDFFNIGIKKLGGKPENIIFIDDNESHIIDAKKLGLKTIHYTTNEKLFEFLESEAKK